jgi:hypothetical protein
LGRRELTIVEIKVSKADCSATEMDRLSRLCDHFFWAVRKPRLAARRGAFFLNAGLLVADRYDAAVMRNLQPPAGVGRARRRRFVRPPRRRRLSAQIDPSLGGVAGSLDQLMTGPGTAFLAVG